MKHDNYFVAYCTACQNSERFTCENCGHKCTGKRVGNKTQCEYCYHWNTFPIVRKEEIEQDDSIEAIHE